MSSRRTREEVGLARVKGYSEKDAEDEANDEDGFTTNIDPAEQRSSAWWVDETSGCPSSLEETIMYMIDSGFSPLTSPLLRDKLDKFIRSRVKNYVKSYRIDVPMSASAFLVPGELNACHHNGVRSEHSPKIRPELWKPARFSSRVLGVNL